MMACFEMSQQILLVRPDLHMTQILNLQTEVYLMVASVIITYIGYSTSSEIQNYHLERK
jgi:hypothetical protein